MNDTIEICARAAYHGWMAEGRRLGPAWHDLDKQTQNLWKASTRAILMTLRDNLSEEMVEAGVYTDDFQGCLEDDAARPACKRIFTAMLTAAMGGA